MFQNISELVVRAADLIEAEGRALRHHTLRLSMAVGLLAVAGVLLLGSILALLGALHIVLGHQLGPAAAWAIIGVLGLGVVTLLVWLASGTANAPMQSPSAPPAAPGSIADEPIDPRATAGAGGRGTGRGES